MMQQYMKELEQDPFSPEEFVERLSYRTIAETQQIQNSSRNTEQFDPLLLHDSFVQTIKDLNLLQDRQQKKCECLEMIVREDENVFRREVHSLLEANRYAAQTFRGLDERMVTVAGKVLHLGDQLDGVNGPRARVQEAHRLLTHLNAFYLNSPEELPMMVLDASGTGLDKSAHIIQKLHVISKDLIGQDAVREKVDKSYDETERALINEFAAAQRRDDLIRMKDIAAVLFLFKGYSQCVDAYIEQSQAGCLLVPNVFPHLLNLCEQNFRVIKTVFSNPDQVMSKFVLNIYHLKLQEYINERLAKKPMDTLTYLQTLYELFSKTNELSDGLAKFDIGNDKTFLTKLTANIFSKHTQNYSAIEIKCVRERFSAHLTRYYEKRRHVKRAPTSSSLGGIGGLQELKRDIQAMVIGAGNRAAAAGIGTPSLQTAGGSDGGNIAPTDVTVVAAAATEEETLLSDELAITMLQDTRHSFQRCQLLTKGGPMEIGGVAAAILDRLINSLLTEHVDYAVELGVQGVGALGSEQMLGRGSAGSQAPALHFFAVVHRANAITHLLDTQFNDIILPLLVHNTSKYNDMVHKKRFVLDDIEAKINNGIDRSLNCAVNWIKMYLQNEQRRIDFRPDTDDIEPRCTIACRGVVSYIAAVTAQIRANLQEERNNVGAVDAVNPVLHEFGIRLHRTIYDHLLQFQFSMAGAMIAVCDINEYRHATKHLGQFSVTLFETLHALSNLLLVKPENLHQVCAQDTLVNLDRSVVENFIQLRSDYKTQKPLFSRV